MNSLENPAQRCQGFAAAISALIDGELEGAEKTEVAQHLIECDDCRGLARSFETINQAVVVAGEEPCNYLRPPALARRPRRQFGFLPASVAALAILAGVFMAWPPAPPVGADQITAEDVIRPMQQIHEISLQRENDQSLMLQTLELNLRTMQLELDSLPAEDPRRETMQARLDSLMGRVLENQFYLAVKQP